MLRNYFKIAFRNLKKNKGFTSINIVGLAIGMASAMLILLWVNFQFGFNKNFPKTDHLYIVGSQEATDKDTATWFSTPKPLAATVKEEISGIKNVSRLSRTRGFLFTVGDKKVPARIGVFVDSSFLNMFELPLYNGNRNTMLINPNSIVLTEKLADNLFGTTEALGKTIKLDSANILTVTGVIKETEPNFIFQGYEYYVPWTLMEKLGFSDEHWGNSSVDLYVEINDKKQLPQIQEQIKDITPRHSDVKTKNFLTSFGDSYLYNKYENGKVTGGRIEMVKTFILIASLILLIACINFMNLSTAQSEKRAKEVGIRKVVGAQKRSLVFQFLSESLLLACISGLIAFILVILVLPSFNDLVGMKFRIPFHDFRFWMLLGGFVLFTGILAGIYPAFFLSSFNPVKVLKGRLYSIQQKINPRKILVVTQFSIALILIVSTVVIQKQIKHAQDRDFGFEKENLIYVPEVGEITKNVELIKHELLDQIVAQSITRFMSPLTERWSGWNGFTWEGTDPNSIIDFNRQTGDDKVVETLGFTLIAGRDFDLTKFPTDSMSALINESGAKVMGFQDPIGKIFDDGGRKFQIIGVIKDFIQESPFEPVKPLVIEGASGWMNNIHIRFNPNLTTTDALQKAEAIFKKYNPDFPFDYKFVDEAYALKFKETQKTGKLAALFAGLTIIISCLGLFGLAAYMAESRTKEIGVRKVLGASVFSVTRLLSKEFILLIGIACMIAFPIAYWVMNKYLSTYSYRINVSWEIFVFTAVLALLITILTVSYQSIKAAMANPVNSLRDE